MNVRPCVAMAALAVLLFSTSAFAMSTGPLSLLTLVEKSELIVVADVESIEAHEAEDGHYSTATLKISSVLKGDPKLDQAFVDFRAGLICPAPPRYTRGKTVLAFLVKGKPNYYTNGLSCGMKSMPEKDREIYCQSIRELLAIESLKEDQRPKQKLEWIVRYAGTALMRRDVLVDLEMDALAELQGYPQENALYGKFSDRQKARLFAILKAIDTDDEETRSHAVQLITVLAMSSDSSALRGIAKSLFDLPYDEKGTEARRLIAKYKSEHEVATAAEQ